MINDRHFRRPDPIQIRLVDLSRTETPPPVRTRVAPEDIIRSPFRRRDIEKPKDDKRAVKNQVARAERPLPRLPTAAVEVDPDGKVTRAEIIKGAGAGFDEEALKAVKQARFEPAQKDGQNVTAEFIYIWCRPDRPAMARL